MSRDKEEELQRLNEDLLAQEEPEQEDILDEETLDALLEEDTKIGEAEEYVNYSNGYRAYNTDKTDMDLDSFSEAVLEPAKDKSLVFLTRLALGLAGGIVLVLIYLLIQFWGLF